MDTTTDTPASTDELLARYPRPWRVQLSDPYVSVVDANGETVCALRGANELIAAEAMVELANGRGGARG